MWLVLAEIQISTEMNNFVSRYAPIELWPDKDDLLSAFDLVLANLQSTIKLMFDTEWKGSFLTTFANTSRVETLGVSLIKFSSFSVKKKERGKRDRRRNMSWYACSFGWAKDNVGTATMVSSRIGAFMSFCSLFARDTFYSPNTLHVATIQIINCITHVAIHLGPWPLWRDNIACLCVVVASYLYKLSRLLGNFLRENRIKGQFFYLKLALVRIFPVKFSHFLPEKNFLCQSERDNLL